MMRTSNPALKAFVKSGTYGVARDESKVMTIRGTATAAAILTGLCAASAVTVYGWFANGAANQMAFPAVFGGMILAMVLALVMYFKPQTAPFCSPVYALSEGAFVGAVSWIVPMMYHQVPGGLVFQAVLLTFTIMLAVLAMYATGMVRMGGMAMRIVSAATVGIGLYYLAILVMNIAGFHVQSLGWSTSPLGIGFSVVVVVIAALNLVMDFQFIEAGVQNRAPRYMEWYGAYGLLVTLVWLYVEVLRLLAKLQRK